MEHLDRLPQAEAVKDKGYEILYLTDDVDEFVLRVLDNCDGKSFKSVSVSDLDLTTEEEKGRGKEAGGGTQGAVRLSAGFPEWQGQGGAAVQTAKDPPRVS